MNFCLVTARQEAFLRRGGQNVSNGVTIEGQQEEHVTDKAVCSVKPGKQVSRWLKRLAAPVLLGAITIYAVDQYLSAHDRQKTQAQVTVMIDRLVAGRNLDAGTVVSLEDLAVRQIPQAWVGVDSFGPEDIDAVTGMKLSQDLQAGMPLVSGMLSKPVPNEFLGQLQPGHRAVTVVVNRLGASTVQLEPDERIDLYVTFEHKGHRITSPLVRNVRILQVMKQDSFMPGSNTEETVTLDVSDVQAGKLIAAQQGGLLTAVQLPKPTADRTRQAQDKAGQQQHVARPESQGNHLAGFTGIDMSFDQMQTPDILYGDADGTSGDGL